MRYLLIAILAAGASACVGTGKWRCLGAHVPLITIGPCLPSSWFSDDDAVCDKKEEDDAE